MRVLLVTDLFPPVAGGLEFHVDALASELSRLGDTVAVATLTDHPRPHSATTQVTTVRSLATRLPHERVDRPFHPPVPEPVARRNLAALIRRFRPDVVHGHSWLTVSLPREVDVPVVFTAHDYGLVCQLRTLLQPDGTICSGPAPTKCVRCGTGTYGAPKSLLMTAGTIYGRHRFPAMRILAVSSAVRRALDPHVSARIDVVPNFISPEPPLERLPDGAPTDYVMYAGAAGAHKGVPELLDVWERGNVRSPLLLATPHGALDGTPPGVVPVSLSQGQVMTAWRRARVALVPSRWPDPCPTVVLEAMRAGTPVVGTRVGGITELVRDGQDGVLVEPGDVVGLERAIIMLLDDPQRAAQMGASGRQRSESFTVHSVVARIRSIYEEVTAST